MDSHEGSILTEIILIIVLTLINAFFCLAEMSIVSVNRNRIKMLSEEGNKKAILLERIIKEPSKLLSTIQVGITLANFTESAFASAGMSIYLAKWINELNISFLTRYSNQISMVLITLFLAFLTIILGELLPKRIALQNAEKFAMMCVNPIILISKIFYPFVKFLSGATNLFLRILGLDKNKLEEKVSKEEIKSLIEVGQEHGVINNTEKEMIESIFEFDDKVAKEIMTPRTEVFMIDINADNKSILNELITEKYSRIPVYDDEVDNIIGILYMKDFLIESCKSGIDNINVKSLIRPAYFVPETKYIDNLFTDLQKNQNYIAILIDEYGGFSGIVTIEDLIEEVVGNILDEYDDSEPIIKKIDNKNFLVDGLISINEVNDFLHLELESEHSDTISGFIIDILGDIPSETELPTVNFENITFKIQEVKDKRIEKVQIIINEIEK